MPDNERPTDEIEGEGSYKASKDYAERQAKFSKTHDAKKLAEEAEEDLEKHPDEYKRAEEEGKAHAKH